MRVITGVQLATCIMAIAAACDRGPATAEARRAAAAADTAFAGVQERGQVAMGVDQFTSTHGFESLENGGRIELQRDEADRAGREQIRTHFREVARRFASGDFTLPGFVHARAVPGTAVMTAKRAQIGYTVESLPRGAALRLRTQDPAAVRAIHQFLAFQRQDHRAAGHSEP